MKIATQMMSSVCQNKREAEHPAQNVGAIALGEHLRDHRQEPQNAERDVNAVAADEGEKGGEERAARRSRALIDHADEFVNLDREEA